MKSLKTHLALFTLLSFFFLSSCGEDVVTDREQMQTELQAAINEFRIDNITIHFGENSTLFSQEDFSLENGFLVINGNQKYDLDKVRRYDINRTSMTIYFL
ncbi:hypothetical protein [Roseivirga sp.]|uniref:hypothetical protein n=1 Tax=Roseivirga sp. TaxID=1964215 RepID=UPI003B8E9761